MPQLAKSAIALLLSFALSGIAVPQTQTSRQVPEPHATVKPSHPETPGALSDTQRTLQALNRLTFGPRPGDVQAVTAKGLDSWIEDQLHPESLDDSALNARLGTFATIRMNPKQLAQSFPSDGVLRQIIAGKRPMPDDRALKMVYSVNIARIQQQDAAKTPPATAPANAMMAPATATGSKSSPPNAPAAVAPTVPSAPALPTPEQQQAREIADRLLALPKDQRLNALEDAQPEQAINFPNQIRPDQRDRLMADFSPQEREIVRALASPQNVVVSELQQAKVIREIYSERQLLEVMTDFWINHFNVYQNKNQDAYYTTAYDRDVIRPHALGKFYDLLVAVAQSPAMLMYLDNWLSIGPHSQAAGKNGQSGLNENYGRELMELHTLGVDGGYTQADVTQLASVLTGWTIAQPDDGGQFAFDPKKHEPGDKTLLGKTFYEAGQDEGMRALDMLAHSPATAHFISKCLATRFVSDDPPESLVTRMAATFQSSDGDIREVMRTMLHSPEFWSPQVYKAKVKTPLEFVVSAVRASGANVTAADALVSNLTNMGMQPYGMAVPTGYSMKAATWENEGALLERLNFSTTLTQGKLGGVQFDPGGLIVNGTLGESDSPRTKAAFASKHTSTDLALAMAEDAILQGDFSAKDEKVIRSQMDDPDVQRRMQASPTDGLRLIIGFILASPDFQHR
jgi:uncharacterized protein (DUF1800 family)